MNQVQNQTLTIEELVNFVLANCVTNNIIVEKEQNNVYVSPFPRKISIFLNKSINVHETKKMTLCEIVLWCFLPQNNTNYSFEYLESFANSFVEVLTEEFITSKYNFFGYAEYGWKKKNMLDSFSSKNSKMFAKYISDYLHINIFIFDIESDDIIYIGGNTIVPYKRSVFLARYPGDIFCPITSNTSTNKFFSFKDEVLENLLKNINLISHSIETNVTNIKMQIVTDEDLNVYVKSSDNTTKKTIFEETSNKDEIVNNFCEETENYHDQDTKGKYILKERSSHSFAMGSSCETREPQESGSSGFKDSSLEENPKINYDNFTLIELKDLAKQNGINSTYLIDNKRKPKTKSMLIDNLIEKNKLKMS